MFFVIILSKYGRSFQFSCFKFIFSFQSFDSYLFLSLLLKRKPWCGWLLTLSLPWLVMGANFSFSHCYLVHFPISAFKTDIKLFVSVGCAWRIQLLSSIIVGFISILIQVIISVIVISWLLVVLSLRTTFQLERSLNSVVKIWVVRVLFWNLLIVIIPWSGVIIVTLGSTSSLSYHKISIIAISSSFVVGSHSVFVLLMIVVSIFNSKGLIAILRSLLRSLPMITCIVILIFFILCNCVFIFAIILVILSFIYLRSINLENRPKPCENLAHLFVSIIDRENIQADKRNNCNRGPITNSPIIKFFSVWLLIYQS